MIGSRQSLPYAGLFLLALAGLSVQSYATAWGGGVSPDSTQYIEGARGLLRGEGISAPDGAGSPRPITLWPPLMSLALAAPGLIGLDPAVTGRWLTALLFAANILLVGVLLFRATGGSTLAAWAGSALMLLTPDLFEVHTWIWSEPLFILLSLGACALVAAYLERPSARGFRAAAAVAALAGLTRFAGAALGLAGVCLILAMARLSSLRGRVAAAFKFGFISLGPLALWLLRNALVAGSPTTRQLAFRRLYLVHFLPGIETATAWLFPSGPYSPLRAAVLAAFAVALAWIGLRYRKAQRAPRAASQSLRLLPHSLAVFLAFFGALLFFSKYFVDPFFPFDDRILSPALAALIVLTVQLAHFALNSARRSAPSQGSPANQPETNRGRDGAPSQELRDDRGRDGAPSQGLRGDRGRGLRAAETVVAVLLAAQFGLSARQSAAWAATAHEKGLGYNSRSWQETPLVEFVATLPEQAVVFSNADDGLLFRTGHPVWRLPAAASSNDSTWAGQIEGRLSAGGSYVVYFDAITWRDLVTPTDLQEQFAFDLLLKTEEGMVLQFSPDTEE